MKKGRVDWQQIPVLDPVTGKLKHTHSVQIAVILWTAETVR
jgi:hypothetical protein